MAKYFSMLCDLTLLVPPERGTVQIVVLIAFHKFSIQPFETSLTK